MRPYLYLTSLILVVCLMYSCSGSSGSEFVGYWRDIEGKAGGRQYLEIRKDGDVFLIDKSFLVNGRDMNPEEFTATYKDGALEINSGYGPKKITIGGDSGHLFCFNSEFEKSKQKK